jgi:hypothetical protein
MNAYDGRELLRKSSGRNGQAQDGKQKKLGHM